MFNSPLQYCPTCRQHVALDQTLLECAKTQQCDPTVCPLSHLFAPAQVLKADQPLLDSDASENSMKLP